MARVPRDVPITAETCLVDDLRIDSLDLFAVVLAVQDRFDIVIDVEDMPDLNRVGDLAAYVADHRASGGGLSRGSGDRPPSRTTDRGEGKDMPRHWVEPAETRSSGSSCRCSADSRRRVSAAVLDLASAGSNYLLVPGVREHFLRAAERGRVDLGGDWDDREVARRLACGPGPLADPRPAPRRPRPTSRPWRRFDVEGREHLDRAYAQKRGVILLANHFGSHLHPSHWLFREDYPLRLFSERPRNVSRYMTEQFRTDGPLGQEKLFISRTVDRRPRPPGRSSGRCGSSNAGMILKIAGDVRWQGGHTAPGHFLGSTYLFSTTWVVLAAMTGAPVVPVFCRPDGRGRYILEFLPAFRVPTDAPRNGQAARYVQRGLDAVDRAGPPPPRPEQRLLLLAQARDRPDPGGLIAARLGLPRSAGGVDLDPTGQTLGRATIATREDRAMAADGSATPARPGPGWSWRPSPGWRPGTSSTSPRPSTPSSPGRPALLQPEAPGRLPAGRAGRHARPDRPLPLGRPSRRSRWRPWSPAPARRRPRPSGRRPSPSAWRRPGTPRPPARPSTAGTAWAGGRSSTRPRRSGSGSALAPGGARAGRGRGRGEPRPGRGGGWRARGPRVSDRGLLVVGGRPGRRSGRSRSRASSRSATGRGSPSTWASWRSALALIRARPLDGLAPAGSGRGSGWRRPGRVLVVAGIGLTIYHRPLARLQAVVPGRIYISAMPTYRGLAIEQERLHFRTIINLFDESSTQASPCHADEIRFVREHGLRYLGSPSDGMESDRFLDETLALARDPDAWPILVHCHGCMDRSPAWMGIYRFLVEGEPLDDDLPRDRAAPGVAAQGGRHAPVQPEAPAAGPRAVRRRPDRAGSSGDAPPGPSTPSPGPTGTGRATGAAGRHPDRARTSDPPAVTCRTVDRWPGTSRVPYQCPTPDVRRHRPGRRLAGRRP